ncbi:hypothetical protein, partial [uncultured Eubacterium sp.]|uniref:hypothetical protein n=1 Tax=uncultured Eubacterium sp. TaxID=165185 RepID=UPI0034244821
MAKKGRKTWKNQEILTATVSVIYCVSVLSFTQKWIGGIHMKPILNIENLTKVYGTLPNQTRAL